jgi:hypothetical protein
MQDFLVDGTRICSGKFAKNDRRCLLGFAFEEKGIPTDQFIDFALDYTPIQKIFKDFSPDQILEELAAPFDVFAGNYLEQIAKGEAWHFPTTLRNQWLRIIEMSRTYINMNPILACPINPQGAKSDTSRPRTLQETL